MSEVFETSIKSLPLLGRGKVRDIYAVGDDKLLIVTTDRLSAYDVILPTPVPEKGRVLNELANFWFARLAAIVPNHLTGIDPESVVAPDEREQVRGRSMVVKRLEPLPVEAVVRGYLEGSGWKEYSETGRVCGIPLPAGLSRASKLPEPIFTPATKAQEGHDENISFERMTTIVGKGVAEKLRDVSIQIYNAAAKHAAARGFILADTKFEFGERDGKVIWIDEALSPDSSRYWPADDYKEGVAQDSFDKQVIRDYLDSIRWDRNPPPPKLPEEVIEKTARRYDEALAGITGSPRTR